jgi:SAM-dependent methyltransferase
MSLSESLLPILRCPNCSDDSASLALKGSSLICDECKSDFPVVLNRPVMLRADNPIFQVGAYKETSEKKIKRLGGRIVNLIPDPSVNLSRDRVLAHLSELLAKSKSVKVLVIGSGGQRVQIEKMLGLGDNLQLICSDIDIDADVDLFCDGHDLPFVTGSFDAVLTTVVLEHVMYPERVASEIHRTLKEGGFLYSEMPFMQQVHEGAYDFTRYSLSGHRRLFNGFTEIDSGMVAGPATTLVWTIENFILAFFSNRKLRLVVKAFTRLVFSWLKYIDYFLQKRPEAMDGASCTYFLGAKSKLPVSDAAIIAGYVGAKHLSHT